MRARLRHELIRLLMLLAIASAVLFVSWAINRGLPWTLFAWLIFWVTLNLCRPGRTR